MSNALLQSLIFEKYKILELIGQGSSSIVYMGKNINTGENVAIKIEEFKKQGNLLEN
jgi:serine/threonine protein kinase